MIAPASRFFVLFLLFSSAAFAQSADLAIVSVVPTHTSVSTDETFQFTVRIRNEGPGAAEQVSVAAGANALALFRGIKAPAAWTCDAPRAWFGYALNCSTPVLAAGAEAEFVVTLGAPQHTAMTYRINALAATTTTDPGERNNVGQAALTLRTSETHAELALTAAAQPNGSIKLEVRNNGPHTAKQLTVVAAGAALSASGSGWKCAASPASVACTRAALTKGKTGTLTVRPLKAESPTVAIESRVRAEKNYDQNGRNNAATTTVAVSAQP